MPRNFLPYEPNQLYLLPPSINDWVPEGSLARFVGQVVDGLHERERLNWILEAYREDGRGRAAYHPLMMLKVLVYAYCHGLTSSRKIARALESDVCMRYLSGNQQPDFRTISDFRRKHLKEFETLFVEILVLCGEAGLAKLGRVALDGRRVPGNANRKKNRSKKSLEREAESIREEVREILAEAERTDAEEDEVYKDQRGDELPEELRTEEGRLKRVQECIDRLEAKEKEEQKAYEEKLKEREQWEKTHGRKLGGRKPKDPTEQENRRTANPTDPDSRLMSMQGGYWVQGFNGQAMADCSSQVIVAHGVTNEENDQHQLKPMLAACEKQAGRRPDTVLADAGYFNEPNVSLQDENIELFIADAKSTKLCAKAPRGRIPKDATPLDRMRRKLRTKEGKRIYKSRAPAIEGVFGQMWSRGLTRFQLRGLIKVRGEWSMWCLTHNLLKLFRAGWTPTAS